MIYGIERVSTGLDASFNDYVIYKLLQSFNWVISHDENVKTPYALNNVNDFSDTGFLNLTYDTARDGNIYNSFVELNVLADLIFNTVIKKQQKYKFTNIVAQRYLWNYYNRSSNGVPHFDSQKGNFGSIVYYLNTCDGFTNFDNENFKCIMGDGLLFKSTAIHQGTGPTLSRNKYCCNIVFSYDNVVY
jgi:hypothetical protein